VRRSSWGTTTSGPSTSSLGVIRESEGVAAQVLEKLGASLARVRLAVIELLSGLGVSSERVAPIEAPPLDPETGFRSTPFEWETPEARRATRERRLERIEAIAREEVDDMGHTRVGAPHRWLGFVRLQIEEAERDLRRLQTSLDEGRLRVAEQWADTEHAEPSGDTDPP
jgi:Clp amino terminal domain, pathogenicity island component